MQTRGKYIVIEGHDGVGKSTQVALLREKLASSGIETTQLHEPGNTPIGNEIRTLIKNGDILRDSMTNLLLFTASRHESWLAVRKDLDRGTWVIAERNYLSSLAYQGYGEGVDLDLIMRLTKEYTDEQYMQPDVTVILSLSDEGERTKRIRDRGELTSPDTFESRNAQFQTMVKQGYLALAKKYAIPVISASQSREIIAEQIYLLFIRG
jgi:dTMP kinase